jgi:hypothetical protein
LSIKLSAFKSVFSFGDKYGFLRKNPVVAAAGGAHNGKRTKSGTEHGPGQAAHTAVHQKGGNEPFLFQTLDNLIFQVQFFSRKFIALSHKSKSALAVRTAKLS